MKYQFYFTGKHDHIKMFQSCSWLLYSALYGTYCKENKRVLKGKHSEVILIVNCEESQAELVEDILWTHFALGAAKVK